MGFYSPQTLVGDARRHGVEVRSPDLLMSGVHPILEPIDASVPSESSSKRASRPASHPTDCLQDHPESDIGEFDPTAPDETALHRRDTESAVRLGLAQIASISTQVAELIVEERDSHGPYADLADLARRTDLDAEQLEALSLSGALDCLAGSRREALWRSAEAGRTRSGQLDIHVPYQPPLLPLMTVGETLQQDLQSTGISPEDHPLRHCRSELDARGVLAIDRMWSTESGRRVLVAGVVTHRQRPAPAGGVTFVNLEDETGILNVIVSQGVWHRYRRIARASPAMVIRGILERSSDNVVNLMADRIEHLTIKVRTSSRDFR